MLGPAGIGGADAGKGLGIGRRLILALGMLPLVGLVVWLAFDQFDRRRQALLAELAALSAEQRHAVEQMLQGTDRQLARMRLTVEAGGPPPDGLVPVTAQMAGRTLHGTTRPRGDLEMIELRLRDAGLRRDRLLAELEGRNRVAPDGSPQAASQVRPFAARAERATMEELLARGLATLPRVTALRRAEAGTEGALGQIAAQRAVLTAQRAKAEARLGQIRREAQAETARALREAEAVMAELQERRTAVAAELDAATVTAPVGGHVHELAVHMQGGVFAPGRVMARTVPDRATLLAELAIEPPGQIDRIRPDAPVNLRLLAGRQRLAPALEGRIVQIGRDTVADEVAGQPFYRLRVALQGNPGIMLTARACRCKASSWPARKPPPNGCWLRRPTRSPMPGAKAEAAEGRCRHGRIVPARRLRMRITFSTPAGPRPTDRACCARSMRARR